MILSADDVARAVIAACRETGANPFNVIDAPDGPLQIEQAQSIARARAYAAFALDKVCNVDGTLVARPRIAAMLGVSYKSLDSYFPSLMHRKFRDNLRWWDDLTLHRVIAAVISGRMASISSISPKNAWGSIK